LIEDRASLVVPGGTTPGPIFDSLCAADIDWSRVDVALSDERWLPETSPRSNSRLIIERLLVGRASKANWIPLYQDGATPSDGATQLGDAIDAVVPVSVLLLGMGADMHTASLFPGADNLTLALGDNAPALVPMTAPGADEPRVTLSARILSGAMARHIVIIGPEKRDALEQANKLRDPEQAPVCCVLEGATVHWAES